ncbi:MAG: hypothetical protein IMF26_00065 [Candidatus Fermentithermobacillus carboniphilus]|uniref:Uncharacterized protein n=1 Tax=Candidatus Fermentithermobacillus carboniphilus TaxID=3085328 RepID=A0AAT9LE94_9FIRM|nr:MAG: hypothetical protein IMF26_00065 [Candidatus Fermentithermobacillus carboniphilus]
MSTVTGKVVPVPEKLQEAIGKEATEELVNLINEVAATVSSTKVDKTEYDAHTLLVREQFERFKVEVKNMVNSALLKGLAWVTVLIFGLFGVLCVLTSTR